MEKAEEKETKKFKVKATLELSDECWLTLRALATKFFGGINSDAIEASLLEYFENHKNDEAD